jgi:heme/copper-type cytochrome/quinol oxidase subunit 3
MKGEKTRLGMILFILSEGVFFLLLILAYVTYHREHGNGPTASNSLDVVKTGVFSLFLFSSSATMAAAMGGFRRGRRGWAAAGLFGTIVLGAAFLVGQGLEYASLLKRDITISRDLFGTTFFTLTGFHGLHVLTGLVMITVLLGMNRFGRESEPRPGAMEAVSVYWHFVDGVWVVIFGVVYLWAFL